MKEETNVILKYKRPKDSWVCETCETENDILLRSCLLCGAMKTEYSPVLKAWSEQDEIAERTFVEETVTVSRPVKRAPVTPPPPGSKIFRDEPTGTPEKKESKPSMAWVAVIIILIVIGLVAAAIQEEQEEGYRRFSSKAMEVCYQADGTEYEEFPFETGEYKKAHESEMYFCGNRGELNVL